jgi:Tfp pilus assembly PilM family ATPase
MRCVQMLKQAGLDVVGMHAEPMAILAAFGHLFRRAGDEQRTALFLDMGAATTKALIAHGKQLVFAKTIHVGGDHFTRQFATARSMNPADARIARVKQSLDTATAAVAPQPKPGELQMPVSRDRRQAAALPTGFALLDAVAPKSDTADTQMQTATAVAEPEAHASALGGGEVLETLIEELQLCVGYHRSMFQERPVEKIVFLGGESRFTDICQRIAQSLHVPAQLGDPLARLIRPQGCATPTGVDLRQSQPGWAVPMGLCLLPTNL